MSSQWMERLSAYCNKSLMTNVISALLVVLSYCFLKAPYQQMLRNVGYFALSGALTNWLAIYMLFEKVPFLYGSGVIPLKFESFKSGIKQMVMTEFFTAENIGEVLATQKWDHAQWQQIADLIEYGSIYDALVDGIAESTLGKTILMLGGREIVEQLREPLQRKMHASVSALLADEDLQRKIIANVAGYESHAQLAETVEKIVNHRLATLTPNMVKEIIQNMIREHLGWLVVWGGVFGGLIGLAASLVEVM